MKSLKLLMISALTVLSVSAMAQDSTHLKTHTTKHKSGKQKYSCPMHPEVTSGKPGKCPKCGMELTKSKTGKSEREEKKIYSCPMHPEVTSDKPGKCSKCGMDLKEKKKEDSADHGH